MPEVKVEENCIRVGERFAVFFLRTLRVPDDGRTYPLPPGLGEFPLSRVEDYAARVPSEWLKEGGVFIPMYQSEALWLGFEAAGWKPNAVKVGVGNVNAVTGEGWSEYLHADPQDYLVCPPQPWLDGIKTRGGVVRQFVASPLGRGDTVEFQLTGEEAGGIRLLVYEPRTGRFPDEPPPSAPLEAFEAESVSAGAMGIGAGGEIQQKIYPDPYGLDAWDERNFASIRVHVLNSEQYRAVTGLKPPGSPISARTYTAYGFPWFRLYDEALGDVTASERLARVKSLRARRSEQEAAAEASDDEPVDVPASQVWPLPTAGAGGIAEDEEHESKRDPTEPTPD